MPGFSLPGTSIGTEEAEEYMVRREQGEGRRKASKVFSGGKSVSGNYPAMLDKALQVALDRARAVFSGEVDEGFQGTAWIAKLTAQNEKPIVSLNQYCLEHGVNCICLTRFVIHLFGEKRGRVRKPPNNGSSPKWKVAVEFW